MSHWPVLERCKALRDRGFPQDNSHFVWALTEIRSEDPKHRHNEWIRITRSQAIVEEIEGYPYYRLIAAPIATELVEEIRKFAKPQESEMLVPVIEMYLSEYGDWNVGSIAQFQMSDEADYHTADTLPNALADLWMELREQEKGGEG